MLQEAVKARQLAEMEEAALMAHGKYSSLQVGFPVLAPPACSGIIKQ